MGQNYGALMSNKSSGLVVKSNALINAMVDLSLQGNRFLAFAIALLDRETEIEKDKLITLEIPVLDFSKAFDLDQKSAYREIENLAGQLQRKIVQIEDDDKRIKIGLITSQKYADKEGKVWLSFHPELVPHLLGLKEKFTKYRIKDVYQFGSVHSWRLYELLRQYKEIGKREIDIDELKRKMGLTGLYKEIWNFRDKVINPATKEISATSDIIVDYSQNKRGRRVVGFTFIVRENESVKTKQDKIRLSLNKLDKGPCLAPELARVLREEYRVSPKQAKQLADLGSGEEQRVTALLPTLRERWEKLKDKKTNLGGYVFKALRDELLRKNMFQG